MSMLYRVIGLQGFAQDVACSQRRLRITAVVRSRPCSEMSGPMLSAEVMCGRHRRSVCRLGSFWGCTTKLEAPLPGSGDVMTSGARCLGLAVPLLPSGSFTRVLQAGAGGDTAAVLKRVKKWALAVWGPLCAGPRGPERLLLYGLRQLAFCFLNLGLNTVIETPCPGSVH